MKNIINEEINRMKSLFIYKRGQVISEQFSMGTSSYEAIPRASSSPSKPALGAFEVPNDYAWASCITNTLKQGETIEKGQTNVVKNFADGYRFNFNKDGGFMLIEKGAAAGVYKLTGKWACNLPPKEAGFSVTANDGNQYDSSSGKWIFPINQKTNSTVKKPTVQIPTELKNTEGVKAFQDWLDSKHSGWHGKYQILGKSVPKGYGTYGPYTSGAWKIYKDGYLNPSLSQPTQKIEPKTISATTPTQQPQLQQIQQPQLQQIQQPNIQNIQTQMAAQQTPEQIYTILYNGGKVTGEGNDRVRIDANALDDEQKTKLGQYMTNIGYEFYRTKNRDGRLVYRKK